MKLRGIALLLVFLLLGCSVAVAASSREARLQPPAPWEETPTPAPERSPARSVVLISIDGLRPDALLEADAPNLSGLWQQGAYSWQAQTIIPSVTLPAYASMVSGLDYPKHGITWNDWKSERGYITVETIFTLTKAAGLSTAMIVGKYKLKHLVPPGSVDFFQQPGFDSASVVKAASDYLAEARPDLLFLHLPEPDSAGHAYGWMSPQYLDSIHRSDKAVGQLLEALGSAGLIEQALLIVTADHGGHGFGHGSSDPRDTTIPWIAYGSGVRRGEIEGMVRVYDTAATVLYALGLEVPADWDASPVQEALVGSGYRPLAMRGLISVR